MEGKITYSGTRAVLFEGLLAKVTAYPNPFGQELTLDVDSEKDDLLLLHLTDAVGRVVYTREAAVLKGSNKLTLELDERYAEGLYVLTARFNGTVRQLKVVKKK